MVWHFVDTRRIAVVIINIDSMLRAFGILGSAFVQATMELDRMWSLSLMSKQKVNLV